MTNLIADYEQQLESNQRIQLAYDKLLDGVRTGQAFQASTSLVRQYLDAVAGSGLPELDFIDKAAQLHHAMREEIVSQQTRVGALEQRLEIATQRAEEGAALHRRICSDPAFYEIVQCCPGAGLAEQLELYVKQQQSARMAAEVRQTELSGRIQLLESEAQELRNKLHSQAEHCLRMEARQEACASLERDNQQLRDKIDEMHRMYHTGVEEQQGTQSALQQSRSRIAVMRRQILQLQAENLSIDQLDRRTKEVLGQLTAENEALRAALEDARKKGLLSTTVLARKVNLLSTCFQQQETHTRTLGSTIARIALQLSDLMSQLRDDAQVQSRWVGVWGNATLVQMAAQKCQAQSVRQVAKTLDAERSRAELQKSATQRSRLHGLDVLSSEIQRLTQMIRQ